MSRRSDMTILDQLAQDARGLRRARMLPTDRPLEPSEIKAVAQDAKRWARERRYSHETLSRRLGEGFSPTLISKFFTGTYIGDLEKVARALNELMERDEGARQTPRPDGFVETDVAKRMLVTIRTAVHTRSMGLIIGPAGVGKTMTLKCAESVYAGSIYLRILQTSRSPYGLIRDLIHRLNLSARGSGTEQLRLIVNHLRGTDRPILVDEAHQMRETALDVIRDIHDAAEVPIILCGTKTLRENVDDSAVFFGQFRSRIVAQCDVTELALKPKGGRPIFSIDEVREINESDKLRLTDDGAEYLTRLACIPGLGGLRTVEKVLMIAARLKSMQGKPIDAHICQQVYRQMHSPQQLEVARERAEQMRLEVA